MATVQPRTLLVRIAVSRKSGSEIWGEARGTIQMHMSVTPLRGKIGGGALRRNHTCGGPEGKRACRIRQNILLTTRVEIF